MIRYVVYSTACTQNHSRRELLHNISMEEGGVVVVAAADLFDIIGR
jgi:hypothetical protein